MALLSFDYEVMVDNTSPESFSFGANDSQAQLTIRVPFAKALSGGVDSVAVREILGYTERVGVGVPQLMRHLPMRHPVFPHLHAIRISQIQGVKFVGKSNANVLGQHVTLAEFARYEWADMTVVFSSLPYAAISDADAWGNEHRRYCTITTKDSAEFIQRKGGGFTWFAGVPGVAGTSFARPFLRRIVKTAYSITWHQIPRLGLFASIDDFVPNTNITGTYGKVNSSVFLGGAVGTMLVHAAAEFNPWIAPVPPALVNQPPNQPPRVYDVVFHVTHFSPPAGAGTSIVGWNLFPHPSEPDFYEASTTGAAGGDRIYEETDLNSMFRIT